MTTPLTPTSTRWPMAEQPPCTHQAELIKIHTTNPHKCLANAQQTCLAVSQWALMGISGVIHEKYSENLANKARHASNGKCYTLRVVSCPLFVCNEYTTNPHERSASGYRWVLGGRSTPLRSGDPFSVTLSPRRWRNDIGNRLSFPRG